MTRFLLYFLKDVFTSLKSMKKRVRGVNGDVILQVLALLVILAFATLGHNDQHPQILGDLMQYLHRIGDVD